MRIQLRYIIVLMIFMVASCGPKKGIVTKKKSDKNKSEISKETKEIDKTSSGKEIKNTTKAPSNTETYIKIYADIAMVEMRRSKIPASITLAQGILESASGRGRLAVEANNHFGIKCHGWKGKKIYHDDDRSQECFRKYNYAKSSYEDHSEFLTTRKRYSKLFELKPNDYKGWAKGLKAAGYATDRKYPAKLISLIERYQLYKYDNLVLGKTVNKNNIVDIITHVVVKGDTLYSLSKKYNTTVDAIKVKNNLNSNDLHIGQELIIANN
ncbi:glucosaminidase domain-containing protein [Winogradskyella sp.]|uniref:glucosaminidase domain-containing protein n=1 Tax=Winogradskyella sp. TaxID=1883156 RepID=UPI003F6B6AE1